MIMEFLLLPKYFFLILGFILIALELLVLTGLSGGWLLFIGLAAVITGVLGVLGIIASWTVSIIVFVILSVLLTIVLWRAMRTPNPDTSDEMNMIGEVVTVDKTISKTNAGVIKWSGVEWKAELDPDESASDIQEGDKAIITAVKGITVFVKKV